jgi:CBS domain-containing protein
VAQSIREVMTPNPAMLPSSASIADAARLMRDDDIGNVLVMDDSRVRGIVTDRDITVRAVADGKDPDSVQVGEICTSQVMTATPDESVEDAVRKMREAAVRRLPVVEGDQPVGIVSLGDLAVERDEGSTLADISAAPPNN